MAASSPSILRLSSGHHEDDDDKFKSESWILRQMHKWKHTFPILQRILHVINRIPPRARLSLVLLWVVWKFVMGFLVIYFVGRQGFRGSSTNAVSTVLSVDQPLKILYIVTTLAEYNNGKRATTLNQDRLREVLLPVLVDSVNSLREPPFHYTVDVYLILGYELQPEREEMIRTALPEGVGLEVWDDASPLGYDHKHDKEKMVFNTRALSRQHRYVIKDKLLHYDMFLAFEDDMRVTGRHVHHFFHMSQELETLRKLAPVQDVVENMDPQHMRFYGNMTERQMRRLVPGFIRVEVLLNETAHGAQKNVIPIPADYSFPEEQHVDPRICCHVNMDPNVGTPEHPPPDDLVIWETNVKALSLRHLPNSNYLDWVVLLPGPGKRLPKEDLIGGYWSGRDGAFGDEKKPSPGEPKLIAQQGGWMATRDQIIRLDNGLCEGKFLPPFDPPIYYRDGQESMNVEFWSGGYQFFSGVRGGCNMQRLISFRPDHFSKHLIYHVANNKQKQLSYARMLRADVLFGQLNSVKKNAEKLMETT